MKDYKKFIVMLLVIGTIISVSAMTVSAGQPYVGEIRLVAFNFAPAGWAECNGQVLPISENDALFNLIGTMYGGDGQTTFNLPDLRGLEPYPGTRYCISLYGVYPSPN
jgi:microcystin-dependent protein